MPAPWARIATLCRDGCRDRAGQSTPAIRVAAADVRDDDLRAAAGCSRARILPMTTSGCASPRGRSTTARSCRSTSRRGAPGGTCPHSEHPLSWKSACMAGKTPGVRVPLGSTTARPSAGECTACGPHRFMRPSGSRFPVALENVSSQDLTLSPGAPPPPWPGRRSSPSGSRSSR